MDSISPYTELIPPPKESSSRFTSSYSGQRKMIDSSNTISKCPSSINKHIDQILDKPKRPLSVYNIFYQDERKRILEEKGYKHDANIEQDSKEHHISSNDNDDQPTKKKRGRPRGKKYKKKSPHRMIGFVDLTICISKRWKLRKKEYNYIYNSLVEENRRRFRVDMTAFNDRKKVYLENLKSDNNDRVGRLIQLETNEYNLCNGDEINDAEVPYINNKNYFKDSYDTKKMTTSERDDCSISYKCLTDEIEPLSLFDHSEVLNNYDTAMQIMKSTSGDCYGYQHNNEHFSREPYNNLIEQHLSSTAKRKERLKQQYASVQR